MKRVIKIVGLFLLFFTLASPVHARDFLRKGAPNVKKSAPRAELPDFSSLVKELNGAVVNISVEIDAKELTEESEVPELPMFKRGPGQGLRSAGSGFIVSDIGHVVTCNHVISNADRVIVRFADDKTDYPAEVIGTDEKTDLALLKIEPKKKLKPVFIGNSDELQVGEWVLAIGNQFQLGQTVTAGIVSAKARRVPARKAGPYDAFIQTDASINPGSSGGPLFNSKGQVIGVNTAIYSPGRSQFGSPGFNIGIGFAIPMDLARSVLRQLKEQGKVTRGLLGVIIQRVDPQVAEVLGLKEPKGALVADVLPDSPALKAGAQVGDVIIGFNGSEVSDHDDLPLMVANTEIGSVVPMDLLRDGVKMQIHPKITELTDKKRESGVERPKPQEANSMGLYLEDLTPQLAKTLQIPVDKGVLVKGIEPGSIAEYAGMLVGDIIVEVNKKTVTSGKELASILGKLKGDGAVLMLVQRQSGTRFLTFRMQK